MKKIFTLIVACIAAISAMADDVKTFTGHSEFYLPDMKEATLTTKVKDAVVLETNSDGSHFTIPDMTYNFMGTDMTIKSFIINVESMENIGKTDDGDVFITWNEDNFTTTTTGADGLEKAVTGTNFKAKLLGDKKELTVEFSFKYGTMPYAITTPGDLSVRVRQLVHTASSMLPTSQQWLPTTTPRATPVMASTSS